MLPRNYQHSSHFTLVSGGVELHATSPLAELWLEPLIREFRFVSLCTIEAPGERVIDTVIRHRQSP